MSEAYLGFIAKSTALKTLGGWSVCVCVKLLLSLLLSPKSIAVAAQK